MDFLKSLFGLKPKEVPAPAAPVPANMGAAATAPKLPNAPGTLPAATVAVGGRRRRNTRKHKKNSRKNKSRK